MKISSLITLLETIKADKGDIKVFINRQEYGYNPVENVTFESSRLTHFILDKEVTSLPDLVLLD